MNITNSILRNLCEAFHFDLKSEKVVLFAIRGALPKVCFSKMADFLGKPENGHHIKRKKIDFRTFGCTIGIWWTGSGKIAMFPGSTVPSLDYLHRCPETVLHFNTLCPGKYKLEKGIHPKKHSGFQRHEALLMMEEGWILRPEVIRKPSKSAFNFNEITYSIAYPGDNLHASRTEPVQLTDNENGYNSFLKKPFSSSGCITIAGQPKEYVSNNNAGFFWNSWEQFIEIINSMPQNNAAFSFLLFDFNDLKELNSGQTRHILRYGSSGREILKLQKCLSQLYSARLNRFYFMGEPDGVFQSASAHSYLEFMKDYAPQNINGEVDLSEFINKTKHFVFTLKNKENAIN